MQQQVPSRILTLQTQIQSMHSLLIITDGGLKKREGAFAIVIQFQSHTLLTWTSWIGKITHAQIGGAIAVLQGLLHRHQLQSQTTILWIDSSFIVQGLQQYNYQQEMW